MTTVENQNSAAESDADAAIDLPIVDGEILSETNATSAKNAKNATDKLNAAPVDLTAATHRVSTVPDVYQSRLTARYIFLPLLFMTVALLGGWRIDSAAAGDFIFLKPALICLVDATILLILFFRAGLLRLDGWFSERFSTLKNVANATVIIALFAASTQIFNALLPERGLPFWVVAFCFFWTLWNNLFADFDVKKLLRSLGGLFGLAFVVKYLLLANLAAPANESWWRAIIENPAQEAFTRLLDLPRFAAATGYIQFFAVIFYLLGLFLLPPSTDHRER